MQTIPAKFNSPRLSIAVLSATALSYEILLIRLFSIIQYHHFAYMIISLALLGYGVSGTVLTLFKKFLLKRFEKIFIACIALFSISMILCFMAAQQIPFNAEEVFWDYHQLLWLFLIYLLFMLPFLFAAGATGLALMYYGKHISQLYASDLLGAGVGSIIIIIFLFGVMPERVLPLLVMLGITAALFACWELQIKRIALIFVLAITGCLPLLLPAQWLALNFSPYKGLPQLLKVDGTRIINSRSSPLGLLQVVESSVIPLRFAPGLSLKNDIEPPPQLAVFNDGDGMTAINQNIPDRSQFSFLDQQTSAAVYHLRQAQDVLILGAGTGNDVLQARFHQIPSIDAVELNPQLIELLSRDYAEFSGDIYHQPGVTLHIDEARGFIRRTSRHYDVIKLALLDSHSASAAGLYALSENYIYTREAIQNYLAKLKPEGYLTITRWIKLPPRDALKLAATVIEALRDAGINDPERRLMLIRHWQTSTLLVKNGVIELDEIDRLKKFAEQRFFDVAYYPGINKSEVNRFNILRQADYYNAMQNLLGANAEQFISQYKFDIKPATDNQPYFFNFFKWSVLPDIIKLKDKGGMPLVEWGYIILIATLVQAVVASLMLILVPLIPGIVNKLKFTRNTMIPMLYFLFIGLGFLFIEIAFMQKFILFLHHPTYSIAVTLSAFLLFAGAGSYCSGYLSRMKGVMRSVNLAVTIIIITGLVYVVFLDTILSIFISASVFLKAFVSVFLISPLAFAMGMPFPLALGYLNDNNKVLVPWVWGVNGCASVISAILAMLFAIHMGFIFVIIAALVLYAVSATLLVRLSET